MTTDFSQWDAVGPEYLDDLYDVHHRSHVSYGSDTHYSNDTGRNDLNTMKVSYDGTYIYFYVKTRESLTSHNDPRWMYLLINVGADYTTGWHGYDYIVNHTVRSKTTTTLKTNSGGLFEWDSPQNIQYVYSGNEMHIQIPAAMLGIDTAQPFTLDFKWADNSLQSGNILDLYTNGDTAPNNRFNYRFQR